MVAVFPCRACIVLLAGLCTLSSNSALAQQQEPAPQALKIEEHQAETSDIVFKSSAHRVLVDVVVTGHDGKPVPGLSLQDFSIAEDGKAQKVLSFDVHDFDPVSNSLPKRPNLPANTFMNLPSGPERGPLYVLLLDLLNMDVDDQPAARRQLSNFVLSKPLGTRFAVFVLTDGLHLVQGFTEDRNVLTSALDPRNSHSHLPRVFLYGDNFRALYSVPRVLIGIAKYVHDLPGRKNVIWFSGSFPSSTSAGADPIGSEAESYYRDVKQATDEMARGQIAVYPVDTHGVVVLGKNVGTPTRSFASSTLGDDSAAISLNAKYMTEDELAYATGGRAFHSTNDLVSSLTEATEAGAHYYTLSYAPSNQDYHGQQRNIHVELAKPGCSLAYRRAYFGSADFVEPGSSGKKSAAAEMAALKKEVDSLYAHMQAGAPMVHQLLFRVHVSTLGPPAKATPEQMASMGDTPPATSGGKNGRTKSRDSIKIQTYVIEYAIAAREKALEVAATIFGDDGKTLNGVVQKVEEDSVLGDGESHEGIYRIRQQLDVPTGAVSIRLGVRDVKTDNVGTLEIKLPIAPEGPTADASVRPSPLGSQ
jgi:VWFA-related protein